MKPSHYLFKPVYLLLTVLILLLSSTIQPAQAASAVLYAKPAASGTGDCFSWANACTLQTALGTAEATDEIWVMAGTHIPGAARTDTFQLITGVAVYGGFDGTESNRVDRDPAANLTILSGDGDSDDSQSPITDLDTATGNTNNSYHVVTGSGTDATAILDGFTITGGYANGSSDNADGGGLFTDAGSPTLNNLVFTGNYAGGGGGMHIFSSNPTLTNVTFRNNYAVYFGGAFTSNDSSPVLNTVTFSNNSAGSHGGAIYNYYGLPSLTNVTFSGNSADSGGGIADIGGGETSLNNATLYGNTATNDGGGIYSAGGYPTYNNTILWGNTAANGAQIYNNPPYANPIIKDSVIEGGCPTGASCTNVIDADPVLGTLADNGGSTQTFSLGYNSSAINEGGANSTCATESQNGLSRPQGSGCDIGAYEAYAGTFYTKPSATGEGTCASWADACTLATALSLVHAGDEVWAMAGTHTPGSSRSDTFQLFSGVGVYGGFDGTETAREQRDPDTNLTVLSGDIDGNDDQQPIITNLSTETNNTGNSYSVVTGSGTDSTALLDGFTITAGNANAGSWPDSAFGGGGMHNNNGSPTVMNVTFSGNTANTGGGMFNNGTYPTGTSNPTLTNVIFSNNSTTSSGGGMANYGDSNPTLNNVTFSKNSATSNGGGLYSDIATPTLTNVTFSDNSANYGGAINSFEASLGLTNVTISGNQATTSGGGIYNSSGGNPTLNNVIVWRNTAGTSGNEFENVSGTPVIIDSVIEGGCPTGASCTNVIDADPVLGTLADNGGYTQTMSLGYDSSAIDAGGVNTACATDSQNGLSRPQGSGCDIGAYEAYSGTFYAKPSATGEGTCTSWADACTLATALSLVHSGDEVWVMTGTHIPGTERTDTFQLISGVGVYGGFDGTETSLEQRDTAANLTILSGDINGDDDQNPITDLDTVSGNTNNSYHVVTASGTDNTAVLDGFTITAGYASSNENHRNFGGGIYNENGSPTLNDITFSSNHANFHGGGMSNIYGSPTMTNITFSGNYADGTGGGLYEYSSSITLTDVTFDSNTSGSDGGGISAIFSSLTLTNITFNANHAIDNGGGMYIYDNGSSPTFTNVTFSDNTADEGAGLFTENNAPVLTNVTFSGNQANSFGGGLYSYYYANPILNNVIFWGNTGPSGDQIYIDNYGATTATIVDSIVAGGCPSGASCTNVINADPVLGALADNGGVTQTMALGTGSSAIDAGGINAACAAEDQRGLSRPQDGDGDTIAGCDIGAYEAYSGTFYTKPTASGTGLCTSWADACTLASALSQVHGGDEVWVMAGTHVPGTERTDTFQLISGVGVYGGFDGTETVREQRDAAANLTILSGDINGDDDQNPIDDLPSVTGNENNAYHVLTASGTDSTAILDGFTITGGYADGGSALNSGAGMYNLSGSPTVSNSTFTGNHANGDGGGMDNLNSSSPSLSNVTFSNNFASGNGGGMFNLNNSNPILTGVTFNYNQANAAGGGMINISSTFSLTNVTFNNNTSGSDGGGMFNISADGSLTNVAFNNNHADDNGGGLGNYGTSPTINTATFYNNTVNTGMGGGLSNISNSSPTLTHVTFTENQAAYGGGIGSSGGSPILTDVTFTGNSATNGEGGGIASYGSNPTLTNVTFYDNTASTNGGGISNGSSSNATLNNVTISGNTATNGVGGGISNFSSTLTLNNTILWGNNNSSDPDIFITSSTTTINDSVVAGGCPTGATCANVIDADPALGELSDNGGETETMALGAGSSAIDVGGVNAACADVDQRGLSRPQGGGCDIGAFESYSGTFYTKPSASGTGFCTSWADACTLATALSQVHDGDEIWVMAGTHVPGTERTDTFQLVNGVSLLGGFDGTETARGQRDPNANPTILSGDINGNDDESPITDLPSVAGNEDNAYHILTGSGTDSTAAMDGFTITAGYADGSYPYNRGAGMFNEGGSPTISNTTFSGNYATSSGGGMYNFNSSSPTLINVTFRDNSGSFGGGMYNYNDCNPTLTNVTFRNNTANSGGGFGAEFNSNPVLNNVTFTSNLATNNGGAIFNLDYGTLTLNNVILWGNLANTSGNEVYNSGATVNLTDSVVQDGCPANVTCNNIFTGDPLLGILADNGGFTHTIAISAGSSAIDNGGTNAACADDDQRGVTRPQGAACDIGAFELDTSGPSVTFTKPITTGDIVMQPRAILTVDASDDSDVQEVQFYGYYDSAWHLLGTDTDGSNGWGILWGTFDLTTDSTVDLKAVAVDSLGNEGETQVDGLILKDTIEIGGGNESRGGGEDTSTTTDGGVCPVEIGGLPELNTAPHFDGLLNELEIIRTKMQ